MQVTVTLSDGTGTQNIDGSAIVQAIPSGGGSLLQVDQYNGSSVELLVDESPATIATDTGLLLFAVDVVPVPLVINASFDYDGATSAFQQGERVFIGSSYGEIIALTSSSMTLGNFVGNQLNDNDYIRGQQSLCTAQIDGAVTYAYPQQQSTYINVGRCQGLKPAVTDLSALNYIYANPKVEILYTTLTESQLNAASAAAGGGGSGWGLLGNAGTDPNVNFLGTTDATSLILKSNNKALFGIAEYSFLLTTEDFVTPVNPAISIQADIAGSSLLMSCNNSTPWQINADAMGLNCIFNNSNQSNMFIEYGTGNVGIGTGTPTSKLTVANGDVEITNLGSGVIIYSPDGTPFRISVANDGTLSATVVP